MNSWIHWVVLGVVILLLFGKGRFSAMMGDVAKGIKSFKKGMSEEDEAPPAQQAPPRQIAAERTPDAPAATERTAAPAPDTKPEA